MKKYEYIIIGFGKGGKTLAGYLGKQGKKVALIEKSEKMYGGTCINVGCIPSKTLVYQSNIIKNKKLGTYQEKVNDYLKAIQDKEMLIEKLRQKNYLMLNNNENITIYNGTASFVTNKVIKIENGETPILLEGEKIFINTGATPVIPKIEGIDSSNKIYTSATLMNSTTLPQSLVIIGGGYIGLEFASIYASFGSEVTVIESSNRIAMKEDEDISKTMKKILEKKGISFILESRVKSLQEMEGNVIVSYLNKNEKTIKTLKAEAVLIATGRKSNIEELNLEAAGVNITSKGAVEVDSTLKTNVPNIWAMGDVNGGLQFTYLSLDDFRIIKDQLFGDKKRTTEDREYIPYSVFLEPSLSRVGLTEENAKQLGYDIKVATLEVSNIPRAKVVKEEDGILKAIVDGKTGKILGCTLLCTESSEMINIVSIAMKAGLSYTDIRDHIFTHPTMSEALNDLFSLI